MSSEQFRQRAGRELGGRSCQASKAMGWSLHLSLNAVITTGGF